MTRRFVTQLGERESIDQVFLASEKQLRTNKSGNFYLQLRLMDRTGSLNAMMWNANDQLYRAFDNGDYVHVDGTTQFYNGALQIIVSRLVKVEPGQVDESDFLQVSSEDVDRAAARLAVILRTVTNHHLRNLAECFLMDEALMEKFHRAPAGVKNLWAD